MLSAYLAFTARTMDMEREALRGTAGKEKFRDKLVFDWRDFLKAHALGQKPHPVMLPWKEFAALPPDTFAQRANEVVQRMTAPDSAVSPVIRNEFVKRPAPKSMADVASLYGEVFATCMSGVEPDNADWKAVRDLLTRNQSPMTVPVAGV